MTTTTDPTPFSFETQPIARRERIVEWRLWAVDPSGGGRRVGYVRLTGPAYAAYGGWDENGNFIKAFQTKEAAISAVKQTWLRAHA